jgi:formamidase
MRIAVDARRPLNEQPGSGHNRWHPDIPPIARVDPGVELTLETRDGMDGQMGVGSTAADLATMDFGLSHPLTGPVYVEGAEPGDLLEVEILGFECPAHGVTAFLPGFGFLADAFAGPYLVHWAIEGGFARTASLPGVAIPADPFAGVLGVAPSHSSLERALARERALAVAGGLVAEEAAGSALPAWAAAGLRTIPPRENGGNLDVRQLTAGARLLLPVEMPGALFSAGDLHFAQGDGEVCGSAIEIAGAVTVRFAVRKRPEWLPRFPAFEAPGAPARPSFATTGIPLTDEGANESLHVGLAARRALLELIDYLVAVRGLDRQAAYVLCSVAADLRISQVVDVPNALVSAVLPLDVFEDGAAAELRRSDRA